jgi:hypothetical protein
MTNTLPTHWKHTIVPMRGPKGMQAQRRGDIRERKQWIANACSPAWYSGTWYNSEYLSMKPVWCREHRRNEVLPEGTYNHIARYWYDRGWHPRFSVRALIVKTLPKALFSAWPRMERLVIEEFFAARSSKHRPAEQQIIAFIRANQQYQLYHQRRRYWVSKDFLAKFRKECFTAENFFAERSQELRRLMLRRGVKLGEVLARLNERSTDAEGTLYTEGDVRTTRQGYLFVKCPSTGQEYLLQVPLGEDRPTEAARVKGDTWPTEWHDFTPSEARRWTFGLPIGAEFVKEA